MRRREFIAFIGVVSILPRAARSQHSTKMHRIAILHPSHPVTEFTELSHFRYWREFFRELRQLGYVEGQNLVIERFSGNGRVDNYPKLARDVAARNPDLVFAITVSLIAPLKETTSTIPIVAMTSDPVRHGIVQEAAEKAGIAVVGPFYADTGSEEEYRNLFATMSQAGADALFVDGSPEHITKRQLIGELAAKYRIPTIYPFRSFVEAGGLMAYGIDLVEIFRQAARVIDRILKGAKPADIPFYQPTKFELVINRTAAKEIGLAVSEPLLARADEVIE
jgi:putative tryptophan/tyrosine transport system substrate-binding protein